MHLDRSVRVLDLIVSSLGALGWSTTSCARCALLGRTRLGTRRQHSFPISMELFSISIVVENWLKFDCVTLRPGERIIFSKNKFSKIYEIDWPFRLEIVDEWTILFSCRLLYRPKTMGI